MTVARRKSKATFWTCQRVVRGVKCGTKNPGRLQKCVVCGKRKRPRKRPAHLAALGEPYDAFRVIHGRDGCALCGAHGKTRALHRDHWHKGRWAGRPRGVACFRCNSTIPDWVTVEWARQLVWYLETSEAYWAAKEGEA